MSLILEALRKSEAERRRGAPPHLLDPVVAPAPAPRREAAHALRRAAPAAFVFAMLVLAGTWGYRALVSPSDAPPVSAAGGGAVGAPPDPTGAAGSNPMPARSSPVTTAGPKSVGPSLEGGTVAASTPSGADRPPSTAMSGPDKAVEPRAPVGLPPGADASAQPVRHAEPSPQIAVAPTRPAGPRPAGEPTAHPSGRPALRPLPATSTAQPAMADPSTSPALPAQPAPVAAASATTAKAAGLQRLADLAPADRSALPPLRMSMHLWAQAPAERFVILDGQRMAEGDRIGEAVVDEITSDGAVLAWQGRRLLVPVR